MSGRRSAISRTCAADHPAGDRDHGRAELDGALVDADAAGEQPVAVGVVHDAARRGAGRGQRPGAHPRPQPQVAAGVGDQRGPAAGTAGAVHGDDLRARHGQQAERVGLPQVLLAWSSAARPGRSRLTSPPPVTPGLGQPVRLQPARREQPVDQCPQPASCSAGPLSRPASPRRRARTSAPGRAGELDAAMWINLGLRRLR